MNNNKIDSKNPVQIDALTQLLNRAGWLAAVQKSLEVATEADQADAKALLFIDLDRFKWVNDSLGHDAGDLLLQKVSRLMESCSVLEGVQADIAGRFGGDEFVVWVQHPDSMARLDRLANDMVKKIAEVEHTDAVKTAYAEVRAAAVEARAAAEEARAEARRSE